MDRVMIVEDDSSLRKLLSILLKMEGFEVILPEPKLDSILSALDDTNPDIMILDFYLNKINGLQIIKLIQQLSHTPPKIIVTSGENFQQECLEAGASSFILKPYLPSELLDQLHKCGKENQR